MIYLIVWLVSLAHAVSEAKVDSISEGGSEYCKDSEGTQWKDNGDQADVRWKDDLIVGSEGMALTLCAPLRDAPGLSSERAMG